MQPIFFLFILLAASRGVTRVSFASDQGPHSPCPIERLVTNRFESSGEQIDIATPRLRVSDFQSSDLYSQADALQAIFADPDNVKFMSFAHPDAAYLKQRIPNMMDQAVSERTQSSRQHFTLAVRKKDSDKIIGYVRCDVNPNDPNEADIGYLVTPEFAGKGYTTEAARAMLQIAFTKLNVSKVNAYIHPDNSDSINVVTKLGMLPEKVENPDGEPTLRVMVSQTPAGPQDRNVYSITRAKFETVPPITSP
jgi:[ribosomal protein S5]-alanine N-acetyltransferase